MCRGVLTPRNLPRFFIVDKRETKDYLSPVPTSPMEKSMTQKLAYSSEDVAMTVCSIQGHNVLMFPSPQGPPMAMCVKCGLKLDEIRDGAITRDSVLQ